MKNIIFKQDNQNQTALFPVSFESLIPADHPVRVINQVIEKLDINDLVSSYKGGGASSYHPRVLLKILIYSYLNNTYTSRKIEKANNESIYYHWLNGQNFPDHHTINNFRGARLKNKIDNIFTQVVILLNHSNVVALEKAFTDGTKMESVANRYTFVWKGSVEKNKEKLENKIKLVLKSIEEEIAREDQSQNSEPSAQIDSQELDKKIAQLNETLKQKGADKKTIRQVEKLKKEALPKLREYEGHLQKLGERNSYSKTDPDATFMRMKEDHLKNGQLKPAYNLQLSTENNFITNYSIHQGPGDTVTYKDHMDMYHQRYGHYPLTSIADAGYGSLENYDFLDKNNIENYVKYNYFHKEQSKKFKADISRVENLYYNPEGDYYICPMGQKMFPVGLPQKRKSDLGYQYEVCYYQAQNCGTCPLRGACHKQAGNRKIEVNKQLIRHKQKAKENLLSEKGRELRGRRCSEVEQTFGQIKWNKKFIRFLLRGIPKVSVEIGLISIAHNLQKYSVLLTSKGISGSILNNWLFSELFYGKLFNIFRQSIELFQYRKNPENYLTYHLES